MKHFYLLMLLVLFCGLSAGAQQRVTGTVVGTEDGKPISFATVSVKGTTTTTSTGEDGSYVITVPDGSTTLVFSFFGMKSKEEVVGQQNIINVSLESEAFTIDETIVVAYGVAKKSTFTGSASTVKADVISSMPTASFENALIGAVPGLQMSPGSGQVGSSVSIRVRGTGSMNATNEPLYVVDGVPMSSGDLSDLNYSSNNAMNSINPNDIESITVLKDAAASALYGSRAANGVVLITTKSGKQGKMSINFRANVGFTPSFAYDNLEKASPEDQIYYTKALFKSWAARAKNGDGTPVYPTEVEQIAWSENEYKDKIGDDPRGYFDWEDAILKTAAFQNYDLNVSGGTEKTTYYASFGYTKEEGRVKVNNLERFSGRLNVGQQITEYLSLLSNVSFSSVEKSGFNDTNNNGANYYLMARNLLFDNWWPQNQDGSYRTQPWRTYAQNVIYYDNYRENTSRINKLSLNETLKLDILEGLTLKSVFGYDETRVDDYAWRASIHYESKTDGGSVVNRNRKHMTILTSNTLSWNRTFAEKHNVDVLLGFEATRNKTDFIEAKGIGLPSLNAKTVATSGTQTSNAYHYGNTIMSVFSRLDYNYDSRYYIGGSIRRDGSSKLSSKNRWGNFWSVSGAWRLKSESFLSEVSWLSNLRLVASYGTNGTLPTDNYGHSPLYSYRTNNVGYNYDGEAGGIVTSFADENLTWETSYNFNGGIESSFFNNRLSFRIEYYNRASKDLLQDVPVSRITGIASKLTNFGEMSNKGIDIEIGGDIIRSKDVVWHLRANASTLNSKITKLYGGDDIIWYDPTGGDSQAKFIYREGHSPKTFWGKQWAGVDPDNGEPMWYTNNTTTTPYKTVNGRSATNEWSKASEVITGCADPDIYGGVSTNISWKGISLDMNFVYSIGGEGYNAFEKFVNDDGYFTSRTRSKKAMDFWQKPGDVTQAPRLGLANSEIFNSHQDRWLYKNNYLRMKNITLSYNLPKHIVEKVNLTGCRVYFTGMNLLTFASQDVFDPEVSVYGVRSFEMPIGKTYMFGIDISL